MAELNADRIDVASPEPRFNQKFRFEIWTKIRILAESELARAAIVDPGIFSAVSPFSLEIRGCKLESLNWRERFAVNEVCPLHDSRRPYPKPGHRGPHRPR